MLVDNDHLSTQENDNAIATQNLEKGKWSVW